MKLTLASAKEYGTVDSAKRGGQKRVTHVLDVAELVWGGATRIRAYELVARECGVEQNTIADACTRQLGINTTEFERLLYSRGILAQFLIDHDPAMEDLVRERLRLKRA